MKPGLRRAVGLTLRAVAVVIVAAGCVRLFGRMDLRRVGAALSGASLPLVVAAATLNLVQVWWRSLCVRAMLAPVRVVSTARLARYNLGMYAANNLLPGRAGELVRIHLLTSREGVAASTTVAVALVEKVFDVIALVVVVLPLPLLMPHVPRAATVALALLGAGGVAALGAACWVVRFGARRSGRLARFAEGASSVSRARPFAAALGWSIAAYATDAVQVALCMAAVGLHVDAGSALLVLLAVAVALSVPSAPSGLGALELGVVAALRLRGFDEVPALACALLYHFTQLIPVTLLGLDGIRMAAGNSPAPAPESSAPIAAGKPVVE